MKSANEAAESHVKRELLMWQAEKEAMQQALQMASVENANLRNGQFKPEMALVEDNNNKLAENHNKLAESGWTIQKVSLVISFWLRE